jgi:hypothetical protein
MACEHPGDGVEIRRIQSAVATRLGAHLTGKVPDYRVERSVLLDDVDAPDVKNRVRWLTSGTH